HESLRTSFHMRDNQPVHKIHHDVEFQIETPIVHFVRFFDLSAAPLLRVGVLKTGEEKYSLMVDMHHIISDGISNAILLREFNALYEGEDLPPLPIQYKDFAEWQNSAGEKENIKQQEAYWLETFKGEIPVSAIPTDYPRPAIQSFEGDTHMFEIPAPHTAALKAIALRQGATLYMVLLAAVNILLSKLTRQEDIVIGTPIAGRRHADLGNIIGMFVNTLAMRNFPAGDKTAAAFLDEVKTHTLGAFENQDYHFEDLVENVTLKRDAGRNPLFDVVLAFQNLENPEQEESPDPRQSFLFEDETAKFDITFIAAETGGKLLLAIQYCTKLFKPETIERFAAYFKKTVSQLPQHIERKISGMEIIPEEEKRRLLYDFNYQETAYPKEKTIHRFFEEQVERTPDGIAVVLQGAGRKGRGNTGALTYRELNEISLRVARHLCSRGIKEKQLVGLNVKRSFEMIIGIMGILKTGAGYVPLNSTAPGSRNRYILEECRTELLLTTRGVFKEGETASWWEGETVYIEDFPVSSAAGPETSAETSAGTPGPGFAYVVFTSGSTGRPKGVPTSHSNFAQLLHWGHARLGFSSADRFIQNLSYYFDWSVSEIVIPLSLGAGLYIAPDEVLLTPRRSIAFMDRHGITALHITPTQYRYILDAGPSPASLRYLFIGAERLPSELVRRCFESVDARCRVFNLYGPTECTITSSGLEINRSDFWNGKYRHLSSIPIGKPAANTDLLVLDPYLKLSPIGVVGELYIAGDGLAAGYLSDPEKTSRAFVPNIYKSQGIRGDRLYKTGDLVHWLPDGNIEFLGRIDHQVKIRGLRIELGEIESRLLEHPRVKEAMVMDRERENGDKYLCAYIVAVGGDRGKANGITELKDHLSQSLPDYMIPSHFIEIEKFPFNPNGKVDRKALPVPESPESTEQGDRGTAAAAFTAPGNALEEALAGIWSDVLKVEKEGIGTEADFFELGGHSLNAAVMADRVHKTLDVNLPLAEIFVTPTIRQLAEYIHSARAEKEKGIEGVIETLEDDNLVLLKRGTSPGEHLFMMHDGSGNTGGYIQFSNRLKLTFPRFNSWGIQAAPLTGYSPQNVTIEELADNYITKIKKIQSTGPYSLLGWSIGGTIAFETARRLEEMGETIRFLGLIDAPAPTGDFAPPPGGPVFTLESELKWFREYFPGFPADTFSRDTFSRETKNESHLDEFWSLAVDYLQTSHLDIEKVRGAVPGYISAVIANFEELAVPGLIRALNMVRTFSGARDGYIPQEKRGERGERRAIETPIHFFAAGETGLAVGSAWNDYCKTPVTFYNIQADHFSILTPPAVDILAAFLDKALKNVK
ncbi:MAG: amino acid adenylation domain-containing protein, partial [bacterium]|nr:amino acid adenylation domain-containing protein [bacterium]